MFYLAVIGIVTLVQSLPTNRDARSVFPDQDLSRRVFWSNTSQNVPVNFQSLTDRQDMLEAVKLTIRETRRREERCRPSLILGTTLPKDTSLCPWSYHTEDEDQDRFPVIIPQAYCECTRCHFSRLTNYQAIAELQGLRVTSACKEVYENRMVLRRAIPGDATSPYVPYEVPVSVACVCQKHFF